MPEATVKPPRAVRERPPRPTTVDSIPGTGPFQGLSITAKTLRTFKGFLAQMEAAEKADPKVAGDHPQGLDWRAKRDHMRQLLESGKKAGLI